MPEIQKILVDAVLFDMDGTLIDSTPGVLKAWKTFSDHYSLGDPDKIAHETHGRRLYDTLKEYCNIKDEGKLIEAIDRFEDEVILGGPLPLPGAQALLNQLLSLEGYKWTIVTSATRKYTPAALARAGIPLPRVDIVTSNDVSEGKPRPAPYLAGASRCGVDARNCLVVEDAVSGLTAGKAAGSKTLAVCTSTLKDKLVAHGQPDFIVEDLRSVEVAIVGNQIEVTMRTI